MEIGNRIRNKREQLGMTQEQLAKKLGYKSKSTINKIESGINDITQSKVIKIAKILNTTPAFLMGLTNETADGFNEQAYEVYPVKKHQYPLISKVACSKTPYIEDMYDGFVESSFVVSADFCIRAKGDCMINARILDGDLVFAKKQSDIADGEIAIVVINNEPVLRRIYKSDGLITMVSENPKYKPMTLNFDEMNKIIILGKAIAFNSAIK